MAQTRRLVERVPCSNQHCVMWCGRNIIVVTINGQLYFSLAEIADALGFESRSSTNAIIKRLHPTDYAMTTLARNTSNPRHKSGVCLYRQWVVNESGINKLVQLSDKPTAKSFNHWVTSVVLPTLRVYGKIDINTATAAPPSPSPEKAPTVEDETITQLFDRLAKKLDERDRGMLQMVNSLARQVAAMQARFNRGIEAFCEGGKMV